MAEWLWLIFAIGTVLCWGAYAPTIHKGQLGFGGDAWKAILCVGAAYFVLAVLIPVIILKVQGANWSFAREGLLYSSIAGALGAVGAICIVAAMKTGGKPLVVPSIIFGCAPVVNIAVSSIMHPPKNAVSPWLYVGIVVTAIGAGLVLANKPS